MLFGQLVQDPFSQLDCSLREEMIPKSQPLEHVEECLGRPCQKVPALVQDIVTEGRFLLDRESGCTDCSREDTELLEETVGKFHSISAKLLHGLAVTDLLVSPPFHVFINHVQGLPLGLPEGG